MVKTQNKRMDTKALVLGAVLTALVIVLQVTASLLGRFGIFSITLTLVPIVIGSAIVSPKMGAWLGFVFSVVVLLMDSALFLAVNIPGTIITVIVKGVSCGYIAGLVYKWISKFNRYVAVAAAAIVCPVVNTGIFLLGCLVFFMDTVSAWAGGASVWYYMIFGLVGVNFLLELGSNIVLSPVIVRLLNIRSKQHN